MFNERVGGVLHKTVSLDLFIFSSNFGISFLIFSTKSEVKLSWTLIFKFLYFFFPFFKRTWLLVGRYHSKDALSVWTNLGKHFVVRLVMGVSSEITTGTRRIMRSDELPFVVRCSRRISKECSYRRAIETHNQTSYKCLPKFDQKDNASLV